MAVSTVDKKQYEGDTRVRLCNYTDVYYNDVITAEMDFMEATATVDQIERFAVSAGDVVITKDSETSDDIGRPAFVPEDLSGVVYGYHLAVYRPFDKRYGRFLKYAFDSTSTRAEFARRTPGVTRVGLSQDTLRNLRIPAPSADEAQQIANYLDHETAEIDAFLADLGLFRRLEDERLDASVDMAFRISDVQYAPLKRLGMIQSAGVSVNAASWPAEVGTPGVLKTGSVSQGVFDPNENKAVIDGTEITRLACPVVADSIIVNRANTPDLVGRAVYVNTEHPTLYLSDLLWRVKFAGGLTEYIGAWMLTRAYRDAVRAIRVGASSTMQKISFERFGGIAIPLPEESARRSAIEDVRRLTADRAAMRADIDGAIALAKERRAALITAAVTGQIDVTAKQAPVVDSIQTAIEEAR
ncbi:restriction endonuclease subunit S [uncultured Microbacterium sp.]|uniref:restriction endonuclease subunit S n=1 Tax=uncultured Microbacterium sp. TaxID=191216 RepID=UPI0028D3EEB1|nr:restriction endonuclease subunit S [uncultured Microbacterium sp.]